MVLGAIDYDSRSTLIVMRGTLTGQRYVDDILRPHTLSWPARSTDLSPVEHVWDQLKRQMPSCHSVHDIELAVQDLWAHLPQDNIRCLINSMPDRVAACIAAGGGPTRFDVAQYYCHCTPRLIVLFLRSRGVGASGSERCRLHEDQTQDTFDSQPHRKKCRRLANGFIGRHPRIDSTFTGAPVSSRAIRRNLAVGHLGPLRPLRVLPLTPTYRRHRLEWCRVRGSSSAAKWNRL
ncbi:transposable element Tcb2 transposase [Trichonephila clavipes]|uniref:Transposable element Tcb2 transposase n=1 Tax=Trichonephila clavipes TaxID=2585209 RepID=A0A8X7BH95_TRICX|nr:transposable element Tcb2 transposase [Trichonephila clavipes]